jgi:hypothetical protein
MIPWMRTKSYRTTSVPEDPFVILLNGPSYPQLRYFFVRFPLPFSFIDWASEYLKNGLISLGRDELTIHIVMRDERILGDSQFVDSILSRAGEDDERRNDLRSRGNDLERVRRRVGVHC